jgi:hypothetical protein
MPFRTILPWVTWMMARLRPGCGSSVYIPSSLLRYLTFKLTWDLQEARARICQPCSCCGTNLPLPCKRGFWLAPTRGALQRACPSGCGLTRCLVIAELGRKGLHPRAQLRHQTCLVPDARPDKRAGAGAGGA